MVRIMRRSLSAVERSQPKPAGAVTQPNSKASASQLTPEGWRAWSKSLSLKCCLLHFSRRAVFNATTWVAWISMAPEVAVTPAIQDTASPRQRRVAQKLVVVATLDLSSQNMRLGLNPNMGSSMAAILRRLLAV